MCCRSCTIKNNTLALHQPNQIVMITTNILNHPDFADQLAEGLCDQFLRDHDALFVLLNKKGDLKFRIANVAKAGTLSWQGWTQCMAASTLYEVLTPVVQDGATSEDGQAEAAVVSAWMHYQV
jgi:hypothetical protein